MILADCDKQKSSSEWVREACPEIELHRLETSDEILDELPSLKAQADFIIADGPGSQTEVSRALLMWADLAVIPCKASMFEARALDKNTAFVRQAQAIRNGAPNAIFSSQYGRQRLSPNERYARGCGSAATQFGANFGLFTPSLRGCTGAGNFRLEHGLRGARCGQRNRNSFRRNCSRSNQRQRGFDGKKERQKGKRKQLGQDMSKRRSLTAGVNTIPDADPEAVRIAVTGQANDLCQECVDVRCDRVTASHSASCNSNRGINSLANPTKAVFPFSRSFLAKRDANRRANQFAASRPNFGL